MLPEEDFSKPWRDPIVEEIRKIREEHAASFAYDVHAMMEDTRKRQQESGRKVVSFARRRATAVVSEPSTVREP